VRYILFAFPEPSRQVNALEDSYDEHEQRPHAFYLALLPLREQMGVDHLMSVGFQASSAEQKGKNVGQSVSQIWKAVFISFNIGETHVYLRA